MCWMCDLVDAFEEQNEIAMAWYQADLDLVAERTIALAEAKKQTYDTLRDADLPVPYDLRAEIEGFVYVENDGDIVGLPPLPDHA